MRLDALRQLLIRDHWPQVTWRIAITGGIYSSGARMSTELEEDAVLHAFARKPAGSSTLDLLKRLPFGNEPSVLQYVHQEMLVLATAAPNRRHERKVSQLFDMVGAQVSDGPGGLASLRETSRPSESVLIDPKRRIFQERRSVGSWKPVASSVLNVRTCLPRPGQHRRCRCELQCPVPVVKMRWNRLCSFKRSRNNSKQAIQRLKRKN